MTNDGPNDEIFDISSESDNDGAEDDDIYEYYEIDSDAESASASQTFQGFLPIDTKPIIKRCNESVEQMDTNDTYAANNEQIPFDGDSMAQQRFDHSQMSNVVADGSSQFPLDQSTEFEADTTSKLTNQFRLKRTF